jgi:tetratricopeptide (TPR) repeat protein
MTLGEALLQMGKPAEALEEVGKATAVAQKLADANPTNRNYRFMIAFCHDLTGRAYQRQKRWAEAFTAAEAGLVIRQELVKADPENNDYRKHLGDSYENRGLARVRAGHPAEGAADLRRVLELWAKSPHLEKFRQFERSRALALLAALGVDAKSGVTAAEAKTFADQSFDALVEVVKTGWAMPGKLKEPDFDAVRGRADFQKLLADAEAKSEMPAKTTSPPKRNK